MSLSDTKECQNESFSHAKHCPDDCCYNYYQEDNVREAIRKLLLRIDGKWYDTIKEIFGEALT